MPVSLARAFSGFLVLVLGLSFVPGLSFVQAAHAESPFQQQMARIHAANQALGNVARARLELEQHLLQKLQSLHEDGHASWLEFSRQQLVVDELSRKLEAFDDFEHFVQQVQEQQALLAVEQTRPLDSPRPLKVYQPGSLRLIGWIERNSSAQNSIAGPPLPQDESDLTEALAKVDQAKRKLKAVAGSEVAPEHWALQARLQLNLASAELEFIRQKHRFHSNQSQLKPAALFDLTDSDFLTATAQNDLRKNTWQVARAEASATGLLKQAKVELSRLQRRSEAIEQLFDKGFASAGELAGSREDVKNAVKAFQAEQQRLSSLQERCADFAENDSGDRAVARKLLDTKCDWPTSILQDAHRLDHLIELRRTYFDMLGQQAAAHSKMKMRHVWADKVRTAIARSRERNTQDAHVSNLSASLDEGQRRQVDALELEIDAIESTIQDLDEKMNVLALEEERFIEQCEQQDRMQQASWVSSGTRDAAAALSTSQFDRYSYLESLQLRDCYDLLNCSCYAPDFLSFSFLERKRMPFLHSYFRASLTSYPGESTRHYRWFRPARFDMSYLDAELAIKRHCYRSRFSPMESRRLFRDSSPLDSYRFYQYGALRPEFRSGAPVGQRPWYIPGSPDNYRGY